MKLNKVNKLSKHLDIKGVQLEKLNWDKECKYDLMVGNGFIVSQTAITGKDTKSKYGIQSPLYASDWDDGDSAFTDRYSCKCKAMKGKIFEGEICPECNTKIEFRDVNLSYTGWIIINDYCIIQPIYYNKLASFIGPKAFQEIIKFDKTIDRDGHVIAKNSTKNPFKGIGLIKFYERFPEILSYYKKKKKNKIDLYNELKDDIDKIFAHSIPVFSSVLRPVSFKNESFFYTDIDKNYNSIFSLVRLLNDTALYEKRRKRWTEKKREKMDIPMILSSVQEKLMKVWELIFNMIDQKEGHIRSEILGGMINFSSRNVIIPDPTLKADEVRLNYTAFLELFKYEIIAYLVKVEHITENEAFETWFKARIVYSAKIYEVMNFILKKLKPKILINRNPTINYGSILCVKIKSIKKEFSEDFTMSLPLQILIILNADFDGDILNIISLKTKYLQKSYDKIFNPRKNLYISRNDGLFNNDLNLFKDQLIGLYEFNNI